MSGSREREREREGGFSRSWSSVSGKLRSRVFIARLECFDKLGLLESVLGYVSQLTTRRGFDSNFNFRTFHN